MDYHLPGTSPSEQDGKTVLKSATTGVTITIFNENSEERFSIEAPATEENDQSKVTVVESFEEIEELYADLWLRKVAVDIGLGFHPDTKADNYSPPLDSPLLEEYDDMMELVFVWLDDPYEISMEAWEGAGLIGDQSTP